METYQRRKKMCDEDWEYEMWWDAVNGMEESEETEDDR